MKRTLGLALGAGGARGIAHIGFLKALQEEGIRPDFISGSSMGSIVGACYAKGMTPDDMKEYVQNISPRDIVDLGILTPSRLGLMRWTKVRKMMAELIGHCSFSDLQIPFSCVSVDIKKGKLIHFTEGDVTDAILASSSIPSVFRPVEKDGMILVDGGVFCRVPAAQVKQLGADVVVAVDVLGKLRHPEKIGNVISLVTRIYDLVEDKNAKSCRRSLRRVTDLWLEPDMGDISQYQMKYHPAVYDAGYKLGKENAAKIRQLLQTDGERE